MQTKYYVFDYDEEYTREESDPSDYDNKQYFPPEESIPTHY